MIFIEQYRDIWLAERVNEFIGFYNREFFCLDNFSSFAIILDGKVYPTVEHAYQAAKFFNAAPEIAEKIRTSLSAYESKKLAWANTDKQEKNWDEHKVAVMEKLLRLKLEQHSYVKDKLLQTGNYLICEDSPKDSFWGIGPNRDGQNQLGKLWMKLRQELNDKG